jgi:gluconolactonase
MASTFDKLTDGGRAPEKVASGLRLAAGPVQSRIGYLLFCDVEANQILKREAGKITTFREKSNSARALTFDHQGRLLACERGRVTRTEKNGLVTLLADRCEGKPLQSPNDLIYAIDGTIYFTDAAMVCRIDRKSVVHAASHECRGPAGVALAPNQQRLYVSDTAAGNIRIFDIAGDGSLKGGRVFAGVRASGLKTDEEGNIWCAEGDAIVVLDAAGKKLGSVAIPETPNNCTWGEGFHDLYVTAKSSIYKVRANVNGTRTY